MLGWLSAEEARASRSNRFRCSADAASAAESSLRATSRRSLMSCAWYTSPMLPAPSGATISKRPAMIVPGVSATVCQAARAYERCRGLEPIRRYTLELRAILPQLLGVHIAGNYAKEFVDVGWSLAKQALEGIVHGSFIVGVGRCLPGSVRGAGKGPGFLRAISRIRVRWGRVGDVQEPYRLR